MRKKIVFQFPGQGSQTIGMGCGLAAAFPEARYAFDEVNDALGEDLFAIMRDGPDDAIRLTRNAQPALFATSMAALAVLCVRAGKTVPRLADFTAGHSLGEYSALAASGSISISEGARLLRLRGDAMQNAVAIGEGAMAAILGAEETMVDEIVVEASDAGIVQLANDNAPGQIVISGCNKAVEKAIKIAQEKGVRRVVKLPVSAPFHCDLMMPAANAVAGALDGVTFNNANPPVFCNVTAASERTADTLKANLITQVTARVRWRELLLALDANGATDFVEIGTGKVLSGLIKRTLKDKTIVNFDGPDDFDAVLSLF